MQITVLKEAELGETRVALIPDHIKKLAALNCSVAVESGAGTLTGARDADYETAGARVSPDRTALLESADTENREDLGYLLGRGAVRADSDRNGRAGAGFPAAGRQRAGRKRRRSHGD